MVETERTSGQIEAVREIALLTSYSDAESRITALNEVQWTATVADIAEWGILKNKHTRIKGDGVDIDKSRNRLDIRNRVRVRLGLPQVDERGSDNSFSGFFFGTMSVKKDISW